MAIKYRWAFDNFKVKEDTDKIISLLFAYDGIDFDDNGVAYQKFIKGNINLTTDVTFTGVTKEQCIEAVLSTLGKTIEELNTEISTNVANQITESKRTDKVIKKVSPFVENA